MARARSQSPGCPGRRSCSPGSAGPGRRGGATRPGGRSSACRFDHDIGDMARAVIESVAWDVQRCLESATAARHGIDAASGRASSSAGGGVDIRALWTEILTAVTGLPARRRRRTKRRRPARPCSWPGPQEPRSTSTWLPTSTSSTSRRRRGCRPDPARRGDGGVLRIAATGCRRRRRGCDRIAIVEPMTR